MRRQRDQWQRDDQLTGVGDVRLDSSADALSDPEKRDSKVEIARLPSSIDLAPLLNRCSQGSAYVKLAPVSRATLGQKVPDVSYCTVVFHS
jgi:hypothetical protein